MSVFGSNSDDDHSPPASPVYNPPVHQSTPCSQSSRSERRSSTRLPLSDQTNASYELILEELRKTSSRLDNFGKTLESVEKRLDTVERISLEVTSSSDSSFERKKKSVPVKVRGSVRDVYKALLEDEENDLEGFDLEKKYSEQDNQKVVKTIIQEMKNLEPSTPQMQIVDSLRRFFQTKLDEKSLKDKGKYALKVTQQRRRNRIKRKLDIRKATFLAATAISEDQRKIYNKVLIKEFISSEESCEEDNDGTKNTVLAVKPLPWRCGRLDRFFKRLDERAKSKQKPSRQATQQTLPRVIGGASSRPKPFGLPDDFWAFNQ